MQFEDADIEEFMSLWREEFGESISLEAARQCASQVMELYALLASAPESSTRQSPPETLAPPPSRP